MTRHTLDEKLQAARSAVQMARTSSGLAFALWVGHSTNLVGLWVYK